MKPVGEHLPKERQLLRVDFKPTEEFVDDSVLSHHPENRQDDELKAVSIKSISFMPSPPSSQPKRAKAKKKKDIVSTGIHSSRSHSRKGSSSRSITTGSSRSIRSERTVDSSNNSYSSLYSSNHSTRSQQELIETIEIYDTQLGVNEKEIRKKDKNLIRLARHMNNVQKNLDDKEKEVARLQNQLAEEKRSLIKILDKDSPWDVLKDNLGDEDSETKKLVLDDSDVTVQTSGDSMSMMSTQLQEVESQLEEKKKVIEELKKQLMEEREKNKRKEESDLVQPKSIDDKENEDSLAVKVEDVQAKVHTAPTVSLTEWRPNPLSRGGFLLSSRSLKVGPLIALIQIQAVGKQLIPMQAIIKRIPKR